MDPSIKQFIYSTRSNLEKQDRRYWESQNKLNLTAASVLIPIIKIDAELCILFTKRTGIVKDHQNQISFPGGRIEEHDSNPLQASLRETQEEIGLHEEDVEILGDLQPRNTTTGFFIFSYVGFIRNLNGLRLNSLEVEKILFIPIKWLQDPSNSHYELYQSHSTHQQMVLYYSNYEGEVVWGVTAAIVNDLLSTIK
jgi:8-oxo-dGTP pyrophosphatase MutT (NUDIX family)